MATVRLLIGCGCTIQSRAFSLSSKCATSGIFKDVVICGGMRTPIGSFRSKLSSLPVISLGISAIYGTLEKTGVKPSIVKEAFVGLAIPAGAGQSPARQAVLGAGLDASTVVTGVNKMSSSGMKAIMLAAEHLQLGLQEFVLGAGMESMSNVPFLLKREDTPYGGVNVQDGILRDALMDPYVDMHLGACADQIAKKYGITREEQDEYAAISYSRAAVAWKNGIMHSEVVPVEVKEGNETVIMEMDEEVGKINPDDLATLKPMFSKDGTVTTGNAAALCDGAAAVILARLDAAEQHHIPPLARILSISDVATDSEEFAVASTILIPKLLEAAGLSVNDIDLFEIHDEFAVVPLLAIRKFDLDQNLVNVHGGSISLGNPLGMTGARIIVHLLHVMKSGQKALAAVCNGSGGAAGMIIEKF